MNKPHLESIKAAILDRALGALRENTGIEGNISQGARSGFDAEILLTHKSKGYPLQANIRKKVDSGAAIVELAKDLKNSGVGRGRSILITSYMTPGMQKKCKDLAIQYLDCAGNAFIHIPGYIVLVMGKRLEEADVWLRGESKTLATPSAIKIVFALLTDERLLNATYRDIRKAADVSIGSVGRTLNTLEQSGYVISGQNGRHFVEKGRLAAEWLSNYRGILRNKLQPRVYKIHSDRPESLRDINPAEYGALWGGEPAAAALNGYLRPERYTLYFDNARRQEGFTKLAAEFRLRPDPLGEVEVLDKFWNIEVTPKGITVPPLLVYADLVATLDPRNIEAAQMLDIPLFLEN